MELVLQDEKLLVYCTIFKLSTSSKQVWLKYSFMYGGEKKKKSQNAFCSRLICMKYSYTAA